MPATTSSVASQSRMECEREGTPRANVGQTSFDAGDLVERECGVCWADEIHPAAAVRPERGLASEIVDGLIRLHLRCSTTGATMCLVGSPESTITRLPAHLPVCQHCGQLAPCTATDRHGGPRIHPHGIGVIATPTIAVPAQHAKEGLTHV